MSQKTSDASDSVLIARTLQDYADRNPIKPGKYAAKRIFAGEKAQITEIAFDAGVELPDHMARTPIIVQVISGSRRASLSHSSAARVRDAGRRDRRWATRALNRMIP